MEALEKIRRSVVTDAILITDLKNLRYFTGFTGSSGIGLFTKRGGFFITDFRYKEQSYREVKGWEIIIEQKRFQAIKKLRDKLKLKRLAFEPSITFENLENLKRLGFEVLPLKKHLLRVREIKRPEEINFIKEAIKRAEEGFLRIKDLIKPGIIELDIATELEYQIKKLGSKTLPFEPIVASGENSAMPHARASTKRLNPGDLVVIDWGAEANGYFSDMTRTFLLSSSMDSLKDEKRKIYQIALKAQQTAIQSIKPDILTSELDRAARDFISRHGYGKAFGHSTGHGIGLDVHELPHISMAHKEKLKPGMVFTVEPGIYIPGVGGVRIEDMVLVTSGGFEILTSLPKDGELENW